MDGRDGKSLLATRSFLVCGYNQLILASTVFWSLNKKCQNWSWPELICFSFVHIYFFFSIQQLKLWTSTISEMAKMWFHHIFLPFQTTDLSHTVVDLLWKSSDMIDKLKLNWMCCSSRALVWSMLTETPMFSFRPLVSTTAKKKLHVKSSTDICIVVEISTFQKQHNFLQHLVLIECTWFIYSAL